MVWIPGGEFSMGGINPVGMNEGGSESMNDARPVHRVHVKGFFMDASEVTNKEFAAFVQATGYVTVAETKPTKEEFPTAPEEDLVAGSVVFTPTQVVDLKDHYESPAYEHCDLKSKAFESISDIHRTRKPVSKSQGSSNGLVC